MSDGITRAQIEAYEALLRELDPDEVEAAQKRVAAQKRRGEALASRAKLDATVLIQNPAFKRWFFTVAARAGIYSAVRHAQHDDYPFEAGRRALGLELLSELVGIDPQFPIDLAVEQSKLEEKVRDSEPRSNPE